MKVVSQIRGPVKSILNDLMSESPMMESLTYKKFQDQAFSVDSGFNVDTFVDYPVQGLRLRKRYGRATTPQGALERGDQFFVFRMSDLPEGISMKDKIVDENGKIYSIKEPIDKILDLAVTVTVDAS